MTTLGRKWAPAGALPTPCLVAVGERFQGLSAARNTGHIPPFVSKQYSKSSLVLRPHSQHNAPRCLNPKVPKSPNTLGEMGEMEQWGAALEKMAGNRGEMGNLCEEPLQVADGRRMGKKPVFPNRIYPISPFPYGPFTKVSGIRMEPCGKSKVSLGIRHFGYLGGLHNGCGSHRARGPHLMWGGRQLLCDVHSVAGCLRCLFAYHTRCGQASNVDSP